MYTTRYEFKNGKFTEEPIDDLESCNAFVAALKSYTPFQGIYDVKKRRTQGRCQSERSTLNYSLEVEHDNRHKTLWMPTFCPMGVLDVLCLDDEGDMSPSFR
jgi:hypothetical protein